LEAARAHKLHYPNRRANIMITWYRVAEIAPGQLASAIGFANEVASYVKSKTGVEVRVAMPIAGNPFRIGWTAQYESLAALEADEAKFGDDTKYLALIEKAKDIFNAGSTHDEIWRSL
jgi:hypothetical protein